MSSGNLFSDLFLFILFLKTSQKRSLIGVFMYSCSKNLHKIYRRTHIPKRSFNKVAKHFLFFAFLSFSEVRNTLWHRCSPRNLLHISRTSFSKNISQRMLLTLIVLGNYCPTWVIRIRSYSGPHFPVFGLNNSEYGHFLRSTDLRKFGLAWLKEKISYHMDDWMLYSFSKNDNKKKASGKKKERKNCERKKKTRVRSSKHRHIIKPSNFTER